jgi:hypothetical protein
MLELLKKFEEENSGIEEEHDDGDDLAKRLQDVDLSKQKISYLLHITYADRFNIYP